MKTIEPDETEKTLNTLHEAATRFAETGDVRSRAKTLEMFADGLQDILSSYEHIEGGLSGIRKKITDILKQKQQEEDVPEEVFLVQHYDFISQYKEILDMLRHALILAGNKAVENGRWYDALDIFGAILANIRKYDREDDTVDARGVFRDIRADTIYHMARVHHMMSNLDNARTHYRDALRLYEHTGKHQGIAACRVGLGHVMIQMGFLDDATYELTCAKQIYDERYDINHLAEVEAMFQLANRIKEKQLA